MEENTNGNIDDSIKQLFNVVENQKQEVLKTEALVKRGWATNCSYDIHGTKINIQTASIDTIIICLRTLLIYKDYTEKALSILGLVREVQDGGYTFDQWIDDFKKRISIIELKEKKEKLSKLESRLSAIISPEERRQMELEAIMNELNN